MQNAKALTTTRAANINADIAAKDARIKQLREEGGMMEAIVASRDSTIKQLKDEIKGLGVIIAELKLAKGDGK